MDEQKLIQAAQAGQLSAFNQLVLAYQGSAYNLAYRILNDRETAADVTQDSFLKAYRALGRYHGGSFRAWLLRIVANGCYDRLRWQRRHPSTPLEAEGLDADYDGEYDRRLVDRSEAPDEYVQRHELAEAISTALVRLPVDQRTALVLRDVEGLDYEEIGRVTGATLGTVKSRISRARAQMRALLLARPDLLPAGRLAHAA